VGQFFTFAFIALAIALSDPCGLSWASNGRSSDQQAFKMIESLFASSDLETAQTQINSYARTYPQSPLLAAVENIRGLIFLKQKRAPQAIQAFSRALEISSNQSFQQYVLYNLASAQLEIRAFAEADETLRQIHPELLDQANRFKLISLQVSIYEKTNQPLEAIRFLSGLSKNKSEAENREQTLLISKLLKKAVQSVSDPITLEKLGRDPENQSLSDGILLRLATLELATGASTSAIAHLKKLIELYPESSFKFEAQDLLSQIQQATSLDPTAIGVLLPMKGKLSKFGIKSLQGIELALGIFGNDESRAPFKLIIEDSGDDPEAAIQALNHLALKHHVIAVIGPMLSKGADLVAQRAQEIGIPLLPLSRRAHQTRQDYVFYAGATQQMQSYAIARYAIQSLDLKKIAILSPNDKLGLDSSQAFWDAVESLGGEITGFETYSTTETDFRTPIDKLSGLFYTEARQFDLEKLAKEREANHVTKRTRKTEQFFALKPIVDYQAVFVPDEAKKLGQIMPTFSYKDVEGIKFLGTSEWNSSDFVTRAQNYGDQSFFVDAFFPESTDKTVEKFIEDYRSTFEQDPSSLEALAHDAARIIALTLSSNPKGMTRSELKDRLLRLENFPGVTGRIRYKDGQFFRDLRILTIKNGKVQSALNATK
jgi:tetratricopeptide (TPR) repeat protein